MEDESWVKTYVDLLLQYREQEALQLKSGHYSNSLFKYRSLTPYTIDCLERQAVWMPEAGDLNDPFESSLTLNWTESTRQMFKRPDFSREFERHFHVGITAREVDEIIMHQRPFDCFRKICEQKNVPSDLSDVENQQRRVFADWLKAIKGKIRICSFSERNDSVLMWSHYSDQHKGICLEYTFNGVNTIQQFLEPVYYTDKLFDITSQFEVPLRNHYALKVASITKSIDWKYEREWRLTFPSGDRQKNDKYYSVPGPKAIFMGARFEENEPEIRNKLFAFAAPMKIPCYQMKLHDTEYKIVQA